MYSKRSEYFRYEFEQPIDATFKIVEINGAGKDTKRAVAKINNLSPHGLKLFTSLKIQLEFVGKIKVEIQFFLNENIPIIVYGVFVWQKKEKQGYCYGVKLESTEESEKKIIYELKKFSKQTVYVKKKIVNSEVPNAQNNPGEINLKN